jgi:hypothetical protein
MEKHKQAPTVQDACDKHRCPAWRQKRCAGPCAWLRRYLARSPYTVKPAQARKELGYAGRGLSKYKHEPLPPLTRAAVERAIKHFAALSATPPAK